MQVRPGNAASGPNKPHNLPLAHPIAILHQYFREVQIRGKHPFAVIDVHYITREVQIPRKHHLTIGTGQHLLPLRAVSALSVALYGMFLAIIIPPARKNKVVAALVLLSFALSFACGRLPLVSSLSSGTRTILLTVALSAGAALLFPVKDAEKEGNAP